ncbi:MAG TPA: hypothetical protein VI452_02875 [Marmoricola sp.]
MRASMIRLVLIVSATGALVMNSPRAAYADTRCQQTDRSTGECLVWVQVPSSRSDHGTPTAPGPQDTGAGAGCYWDPSKQGLSKPPAGPVPCSSGAGYWSNSYNCYISAAKPPPPAGDPSWHGHPPGDGAVYDCYQPQTDIDVYIWAADPPPGSATGPSPRDVAQVAVKKMGLSAIDIGIAPEPGPNSVGIVGMPVWLWVQDPNAHTFGPATASASAGGITVAATARVRQITWDLGDGTQVVCQGAGTPYQPSYGDRQSPDCGHVYDKSSAHQPGGRYTVTATSEWVITWQGAGQTGTIRLDGLTRSVQITVGEAQVLVQ